MQHNQQVIKLEGNSKANTTKRRYNCTNFKFVLWLYKNEKDYPGVIRAGYKDTLDAAYGEDLLEGRVLCSINKKAHGSSQSPTSTSGWQLLSYWRRLIPLLIIVL